MSDEYESLGEFIIVKTTDAAIAIDMGEVDEDGKPEWQWLPRSVVDEGEIMDEGQEYEIDVKAWFLEKEGLV